MPFCSVCGHFFGFFPGIVHILRISSDDVHPVFPLPCRLSLIVARQLPPYYLIGYSKVIIFLLCYFRLNLMFWATLCCTRWTADSGRAVCRRSLKTWTAPADCRFTWSTRVHRQPQATIIHNIISIRSSSNSTSRRSAGTDTRPTESVSYKSVNTTGPLRRKGGVWGGGKLPGPATFGGAPSLQNFNSTKMRHLRKMKKNSPHRFPARMFPRELLWHSTGLELQQLLYSALSELL